MLPFKLISSSILLILLFDVNIMANQSEVKIFDFRLPLAGGLAGGLSNAILYPIDTIKTIRQANPDIKTSWEAFRRIRKEGMCTIYSGIIPSALGSIPSSALYFGAYETSKRLISTNFKNCLPRQSIHMLSAALGNILSSIVFVPKEVIKQQLQVLRTKTLTLPVSHQILNPTIANVLGYVYKTKGIAGFYSGYLVTLARNIPSAMIRFTLYEELRIFFDRNENTHSVAYALAGAIASAASCTLTAPMDLIKTRMATGGIARGTPFYDAMRCVVQQEGLLGLYAGLQPRLVLSALFGGVGFSLYEIFKTLLAVESTADVSVSDYRRTTSTCRGSSCQLKRSRILPRVLKDNAFRMKS